MVQMTPADQKVVKAIPGNDKCAECGMKQPQWASVSFGTIFCLECSGVHRSLGVHISFVRSIAMDSWTPQQLALMKAGGNDKCKAYLSSKGISPSLAIKEKYESPAAQLYKEVLKARVEGRPEPTELPKPKPRAPAGGGRAGGAIGAVGKPGEDPNGMERLTGESEAQYVARQTRLRDEARARMAAKFRGGGGMSGVGGGGGRMGGVGSDPNYNPNGGYGGGYGGSIDVNSAADALMTGFGTAFSTFGSAASTAASAATSVAARASEYANNPETQRTISGVAGSVRTTGVGFWGSLTSAASQVTSTITQPDEGDGLADLQRQMSSQRTGKYSGFGSETAGRSMNPTAGMGHASSVSSTSNGGGGGGGGGVGEAVAMPGEDPNGIARLTGETDDQYVARQTRIRDEAKARMAAKFGGGKPNMTSVSGGGGGFGLVSNPSSSAPTSMNGSSVVPRVSGSAPTSGNMGAKKMQMKIDSSDDFFANFGA